MYSTLKCASTTNKGIKKKMNIKIKIIPRQRNLLLIHLNLNLSDGSSEAKIYLL